MLNAPAISVQFKRSLKFDTIVDPVEAVGSILNAPDRDLDYAEAKLVCDAIVDPSFDAEAVRTELDCLTSRAQELANGDSRSGAKLAAIRTLIYDSGPWNDYRPFAYDRSDPLGRHMHNKLLHNYVATRLGQCVSMPVLFLILAERLGLNVALCTAPDHVFVRFIDENDRAHNLETTSGAHPARDEWYCQNFPITERAIETGLYLRTLTKREGVAIIASIVVEYLYEGQRFDEVIAVCEMIAQSNPRDANVMLAQGSAYGMLLEQFRQVHPNPLAIPPMLRGHATMLMKRNANLFAAAEKLGWVPFE